MSSASRPYLLHGSWGRVAGALAIALAASAAAIRAPVATAVVAASGVAAVVAVRRGRAERRRRETAGERVPVERVGGCALAPGQSLHAVRFEGRVLLLGATPSSITVLASASASAAPSPRSSSARRLSIAPAVLVALALSGGVAWAAQGESAEQSADLNGVSGGPSAPGVATPRAASDVGVPPLLTAPGVGAGAFVWLAALAIAPFVLMTTTSFVKISVVLSLVRSALGTPQIPSDPVLAAIALALTVSVMSPVAREVAARATASGADLSTAAGAVATAMAAVDPVRSFLRRNTRPEEVALFVELSARDGAPPSPPDSLPVLVPAFVTSELRQAFVAGFLVFVPFLVVDLVVSNILMSMGMVMVSPTTVSLPFKVLVFVLVDGWTLLMKGLALSYH